MEKIVFAVLVAAFLCFAKPRVAITRAQRRFIRFAFAMAFLLSFPTQKAFSQGNTYEGPIGVTGIFNGNVATGCSYDPLTHSAHREITDMIVPGSIGKYPLKMTRYYNSRQQYYALTAIGLSPGWAHEYSWLLYTAGEKVVSPHGNVYDFHCGAPVGVSEAWDDGIQGPHPNGGTWRLADGGKVNFNGSQVNYIEDPYGLRTTIEYQNGLRWRVTESGGRCLVFSYNTTDPSDNTRLLTRVEAYDYYNGHRIDWVVYSYTNVDSGGRDPINGQPIIKKMLTGVTYSDGTSASYAYTTDNVQGTQNKLYPLLQRSDDVRYNGPMHTIVYDYQNVGPHGAITAEKYPSIGAVSSIDPGVPTNARDLPEIFTETRGDGPTRTFTYTSFHHCQGNECGPCSDYEDNTPPQQMLKEYTDFQGHTTWLGYDERYSHWYVNSVTDARGSGRGDPNHTVLYQRGDPPPNGIGEILSITHPNNTGIVQYAYYRNGNIYDPHYLTSITDEHGNKTIHTRDLNTHKITQTDYKAADGTLLARETFTYCDQADPQCSNNPLGQIKTHHLKNGAYVHYRYDSRGLLIDKWEPTWTATASDSEPKTHYGYYTTEYSYTATDGQLVYPWTDRVMTVTGPPPNWPYTDGPASETYEYDRVLGASGITDLSGAARAGRNLVTRITHADETFQRFAYDAYRNKRWEDNELRKASSYAYDAYSRLLNVTRPLNGITTYTYNPTNGTALQHTTNNPDTVTVRTSATTNFKTRSVYDENFRKTSATAADGTASAATTWFHFDPVGNQDYVTDPRGSSTPSAQWTTYTDYDNRNRKWQVREPLGRTTQFYYDDKINITRIVRPDQTTETKAYDGMNRVLTDTVPKETGINIVTRFDYYPWNVRSASLLQKVTDGEIHYTTFEYNPSGLKTKMTYSDNSMQSWAYDDAHNLKSRTTVGGEIQDFKYDNRNRKTGEWWDGFPADGEWRVFGYDDANHLTLATNGTGNPWTNLIADVRRSYNDAGRLTHEWQTVTGLGTKDVAYPSYDDDGRLTQMSVSDVSPAYDYIFSYDDMRRLKFIFSTGNQSALFQYSYDVASNVAQRYNWQNRVAQIYTPDALNRTTSVEVKNTNPPETRLGLEIYDYYTIGRLHTVTREDNKQDQFVYFLDGELKQATYGAAATPPPSPTPTPTPPGGQVATPTFNPDGAYFSACANSYTFNVTISTTTSSAQIRWTIDGSTPSPTNGTLINGTSGVASFTVSSNQTKTLQAIGYKTGMTPSNIHRADYTFERECQGPIAPQTDGIIPYPLDTAGGRLNQAPMAPAVSTVTYNLDKAGNRLSAYGQNYSPNTINQYTSVGGNPVTNGSEHEIQVYGGFTYSYMRDQELQRITGGPLIYDVAYDALGRCVKQTVNGDSTYPIYYIYDGDKPILEYRANGALGRNLYGIGIDEILQRYDPAVNGGQWFYFQQDHEGSVTHLTNWNNYNGQIVERYRYDAFGTPTIYAPNWTGRNVSFFNNRFLFTGREYLGAWVYEYRARVYHAALGRFMSEDAKLFDAGDYNLFRYCHNDPIDFTDPMGTTDERREPWYNHQEQAKALNRQMAHLVALQKALGWPGHGAIQMGQVNFAIAQTGVQLRASYAAINQQKLSQLGSVFRPIASRFLGSANEVLNPEGYEVKIAAQGGYRSFAEQAGLRAFSDAGGPHANRPGESAHNYGAAIDIDVIKGSRANEDIGRRAYSSLSGRLGALGESQGLIWGGHFTHADPPHFQYSGIPVNGPDMLRLHQQLLRTTGAGLDTLMEVP
jgi:RHS repeat-associated protein